jgi:hypothetical protein
MHAMAKATSAFLLALLSRPKKHFKKTVNTPDRNSVNKAFLEVDPITMQKDKPKPNQLLHRTLVAPIQI